MRLCVRKSEWKRVGVCVSKRLVDRKRKRKSERLLVQKQGESVFVKQ